MLPRFVIVPAVAISKDSFLPVSRVYTSLLSDGYDIYDNLAKLRLKPSYQCKGAADIECAKMNMGSIHPQKPDPLLGSDL